MRNMIRARSAIIDYAHAMSVLDTINCHFEGRVIVKGLNRVAAASAFLMLVFAVGVSQPNKTGCSDNDGRKVYVGLERPEKFVELIWDFLSKSERR